MREPVTNRRNFLETIGTASILVGSGVPLRSLAAGVEQKLALDGGKPVRTSPLGARPYGPQFYDDVEKRELLEVLESRVPFRWSRGPSSKVLAFEKEYAAHIGVKFALGVTSGTTALYTAMAALEVGPGDEVILPAWTSPDSNSASRPILKGTWVWGSSSTGAPRNVATSSSGP